MSTIKHESFSQTKTHIMDEIEGCKPEAPPLEAWAPEMKMSSLKIEKKSLRKRPNSSETHKKGVAPSSAANPGFEELLGQNRILDAEPEAPRRSEPDAKIINDGRLAEYRQSLEQRYLSGAKFAKLDSEVYPSDKLDLRESKDVEAKSTANVGVFEFEPTDSEGNLAMKLAPSNTTHVTPLARLTDAPSKSEAEEEAKTLEKRELPSKCGELFVTCEFLKKKTSLIHKKLKSKQKQEDGRNSQKDDFSSLTTANKLSKDLEFNRKMPEEEEKVPQAPVSIESDPLLAKEVDKSFQEFADCKTKEWLVQLESAFEAKRRSEVEKLKKLYKERQFSPRSYRRQRNELEKWTTQQKNVVQKTKKQIISTWEQYSETMQWLEKDKSCFVQKLNERKNSSKSSSRYGDRLHSNQSFESGLTDLSHQLNELHGEQFSLISSSCHSTPRIEDRGGPIKAFNAKTPATFDYRVARPDNTTSFSLLASDEKSAIQILPSEAAGQSNTNRDLDDIIIEIQSPDAARESGKFAPSKFRPDSTPMDKPFSMEELFDPTSSHMSPEQVMTLYAKPPKSQSDESAPASELRQSDPQTTGPELVNSNIEISQTSLLTSSLGVQKIELPASIATEGRAEGLSDAGKRGAADDLGREGRAADAAYIGALAVGGARQPLPEARARAQEVADEAGAGAGGSGADEWAFYDALARAALRPGLRRTGGRKERGGDACANSNGIGVFRAAAAGNGGVEQRHARAVLRD